MNNFLVKSTDYSNLNTYLNLKNLILFNDIYKMENLTNFL